jgi:hypothetical protein
MLIPFMMIYIENFFKDTLQFQFIITDLLTNTNIYSSLPVLRKLGVLKEGREILKNEDSLNMMKVWLALEVRQFIHASIQDVRILKQLLYMLYLNFY